MIKKVIQNLATNWLEYTDYDPTHQYDNSPDGLKHRAGENLGWTAINILSAVPGISVLALLPRWEHAQNIVHARGIENRWDRVARRAYASGFAMLGRKAMAIVTPTLNTILPAMLAFSGDVSLVPALVKLGLLSCVPGITKNVVDLEAMGALRVFASKS